MKNIAIFLLFPLFLQAQDSIQFIMGNNRVTIYKDGHGRRIPIPTTSSSGKFLINTNGSLSWSNLSGSGASLTGLTAAQVGLGFVTNESKSTMFTNATFTGTFNVADGSIANVDLANEGWLQKLRVAGSDFTTTSTSLVDITGLVSSTLSTSTLYEFEAVLYVNSTSTAGLAIGIQQSGTGSGQIGGFTGTANSAAATGATIASNALNTATAACVLVNGDGFIQVRGFVKTGSSGSPTISLKILKTTSGTAKVYIGSVLRIKQAN